MRLNARFWRSKSVKEGFAGVRLDPARPAVLAMFRFLFVDNDLALAGLPFLLPGGPDVTAAAFLLFDIELSFLAASRIIPFWTAFCPSPNALIV